MFFCKIIKVCKNFIQVFHQHIRGKMPGDAGKTNNISKQNCRFIMLIRNNLFAILQSFCNLFRQDVE